MATLFYVLSCYVRDLNSYCTKEKQCALKKKIELALIFSFQHLGCTSVV